jgi:DNA-binding NarL/FixJ family response regulator
MTTRSDDGEGTQVADRPIRLAVVEDHAAVMKGVELIIRSGNMELVGAASNAEDGYGVLLESAPDVALIDINLPGESGADLTERILRDMPALGVLLYTGLADNEQVSRGLERGALGVALKAGEPDELLDAIRTVAGGGRYVDPRIEMLVSGVDPNGSAEGALVGALARGRDLTGPRHEHPDDAGVPDFLDRVLALLIRVLDMDAAYIGEFSGSDQILRFTQGDIESFGVSRGGVLALRDTYCLKVMSSTLSNVVPDTRASDVTAGMEFTYEANVGAYLGVPIWFTDRLHYGTLCAVSHARRSDLSPSTQGLLTLTVRYVAEELEQRSLERRLRLSPEEVEMVRRARQQGLVREFTTELCRHRAQLPLLNTPLHEITSMLSGRSELKSPREALLARHQRYLGWRGSR